MVSVPDPKNTVHCTFWTIVSLHLLLLVCGILVFVILLELLFIRSGVQQLDNFYFSVSDVKVLIDNLCTC